MPILALCWRKGNNSYIGDLTPCIPLSLEGEGDGSERGAYAPLKHLYIKSEQRRVKERLHLSYTSVSPFPLIRGRGIKGDGVA
jgi:hypothetical protein